MLWYLFWIIISGSFMYFMCCLQRSLFWTAKKQVIIDEASQATEPRCLVAFQLLGEHVIFWCQVEDPLQKEKSNIRIGWYPKDVGVYFNLVVTLHERHTSAKSRQNIMIMLLRKARKQFILVGDQKQLPPVVLCQPAAEKGRCVKTDKC